MGSYTAGCHSCVITPVKTDRRSRNDGAKFNLYNEGCIGGIELYPRKEWFVIILIFCGQAILRNNLDI